MRRVSTDLLSLFIRWRLDIYNDNLLHPSAAGKIIIRLDYKDVKQLFPNFYFILSRIPIKLIFIFVDISPLIPCFSAGSEGFICLEVLVFSKAGRCRRLDQSDREK